MNIKYKYDISDIENDFLKITFFNESDLQHIDSIKILRNANGDIDIAKVDQQVNELFQRVLDKKNFIFP